MPSASFPSALPLASAPSSPSTSSIATSASTVIAFINCWNNFQYGLVLGGRDTITMTVAVAGFVSYEAVLWGQLAAASIVTILPGMIMILLVQRWVVRGLTFGAVKS